MFSLAAGKLSVCWVLSQKNLQKRGFLLLPASGPSYLFILFQIPLHSPFDLERCSFDQRKLSLEGLSVPSENQTKTPT